VGKKGILQKVGRSLGFRKQTCKRLRKLMGVLSVPGWMLALASLPKAGLCMAQHQNELATEMGLWVGSRIFLLL